MILAAGFAAAAVAQPQVPAAQTQPGTQQTDVAQKLGGPVKGGEAGGGEGEKTPLNVDIEQVTWRLAAGDARIVVIGDSFAGPTWTRVFPALLRVWSFGRLSAIAGGATSQSQLCNATPEATPNWSIQASPGSYRVFNAGGGPEYMALPTRGITEFGGIGITTLGPGGKYLGIRLWNDTFDPVGTDRPLRFGEDGRVRLLFHTPYDTSRVIDDVEVRTSIASTTIDLLNGFRKKRLNGGEPDGTLNPATPGQIDAAWVDLPITLSTANNRPEVGLYETTPISLTGKYLHPAGAVWYRTDKDGSDPAPGLYYSYLADPSWSYRGFWTDRPSIGSLDKFVSVEQMAHWMDVTTLRPEQPVIFIYYFAAENEGGGPFDEQLPALLDAMDRVATIAGVDDVFHFFVLPHFHDINAVPIGEAQAYFDEQRNEMYKLAAQRPDVAAMSIYDATDKVFFDGSLEAQAWLAANGYSSFNYAGNTVDLVAGESYLGRLVDGFDLHPSDSAAAAFFASIISDQLDLPVRVPDVNLDGVVDIEDLHEQAHNPIDLNGDGEIDQADDRALEHYLRRTELRPRRR